MPIAIFTDKRTDKNQNTNKEFALPIMEKTVRKISN